MILGVALLFVGFTLIHNGIARLAGYDEKSVAVMNVFMGLLLTIINIIALMQGDAFSAGQGFLFAFTYLYLAANKIWGLDYRPFGWFCLFVTINAIPLIAMSYSEGDWRFGTMWIIWAIFWLSGFVEINLKKNLGTFGGILPIFAGLVSAWIPGFIMMIGKW